MFTGSLPEMHLMSYGWVLYNNIWALLGFIGITVIPFIWIMFTTVVDAVTKYGPMAPEASAAAWFTVMPTMLLMLGVYALAVMPSVPLKIDAWEYSEICTASNGAQQETDRMTPGNTGTPLDQARVLMQSGMSATDARVPILWDMVMRVGAGFSRALNSGGACPTNTTYLDSELRKMSIKDPALQAELGQFAADCYIPARGRYMRAMQSGTLDTVPTVNDATNPDQYFAATFREWRSSPPPNRANDELFSRDTDPGYIGSRFFLETPGLYAPAVPGQYKTQVDTLKASVPIAGWPYDPFRDCEHNNAAAGDFCTNPNRNSDMANNYGSPTCDEWWTDPDRGLQQKLRQSAEGSINLYRGFGGAAVTPSDALNTVISNSNPADVKSDAWLADKMVATALVNDPETQKSTMDKIKENMRRFSDFAAGDGEFVSSSVPWAEGGAAALLAGGLSLASTALSSVPARGVAAAVSVNLAMSAIDFYTTSWIVRHAYPIAQAYLMLFFIAVMPFVLVGSLYDLGRLLQLVLLFLGIQFLGPWRYVVEFLDERLFEIMFPDQYGSLGTDLILKTPERILVDITTTAMYTVFPFILLWLVGLMGVDASKKIGDALTPGNLQNFSSGVAKSLNSGLSVVHHALVKKR
jgi:hypothetical protein